MHFSLIRRTKVTLSLCDNLGSDIEGDEDLGGEALDAAVIGMREK